MHYSLRPLRADDSGSLLELNNTAVPAVNPHDEKSLTALLAASSLAIAVVDDSRPREILGFAVVFAAAADYASENYRWFSAQSDDFLYVDRIVVSAGARNQGLGRVLYAAIFEVARADGISRVFCEVNVAPPNPRSLPFHARLGFVEIGRQSTKDDTVVVSLLTASAEVRPELPVRA